MVKITKDGYTDAGVFWQEFIVAPLVTFIFMLPTAWVIMLLEGAVAHTYGLPLLGFWTVYLTVNLIDWVSGVVFHNVNMAAHTRKIYLK